MHYAIDKKYPIEDEGQIKVAVEYFDKYLTRFDPMKRAVIAHNIEKRSHALGVKVDSSWVTNYSRMFNKTASMSPDFSKNIEARKTICEQRDITFNVGKGHVKAAEVLDRLVNQAKRTPNLSVMKTIEEFDKKASLTSDYDNKIVDPVLTVFGSLNNPKFDAEKVAGTLTQYEIKEASTDAGALQKIAGAFGKDFMNSFRKNPVETVEQMGAPEKSLLVETLA